MNKLLIFTALAAASLLSSCQNPSSINGPGTVLPLSVSTPPAQPVITYPTTVIIKKDLYYAIGVMDSTGGNQTALVSTAPTSIDAEIRQPCWNYSGSSIAYLEDAVSLTTAPNYIKTVDVTVNSKGVPVGSTPATIYSLAASDSAYLPCGPAWCATSSTAKIAFIRDHLGSQLGLSELCTIPQTGGAVTVLASYKKFNSVGTVVSHFTSPTWSPDDSKIAVFREDTFTHGTIMIYNSTTGAATDSIPMSIFNWNHLEWSHSGANLLAFTVVESGSGPVYIYYCVPTTGSTPSTNSVEGWDATWSPNNSGLMYNSTGTSTALMKVVAQTSSTSQILSSSPTNANGWLNWAR
jgi:hypothetical protein